MKNINKYKYPQDSLLAWHEWANSGSGCISCKLRLIDMAILDKYSKKNTK